MNQDTLIFETKSGLDLRALTTFGLNAKPNTENPIGYFGTGLKYAIAVLMRHEARVTFNIQGMVWTVEREYSSFRQKQFAALYLQRYRGKMIPVKKIPLPFTPELGKDWKLWYAYRELFANTVDENGLVYLDDEYAQERDATVKRTHTRIIVECPALVAIHADRAQYFLLAKRKGKPFYQDDAIEIYTGQSSHVFYKGIRVYESTKPFKYTYNIKRGINLTEDRTASQFEIEWTLSKFAVTHTDHVPDSVVETFVRKSDYAEASIRHHKYHSPSQRFLDIAGDVMREGVASVEVMDVVKRYLPPARRTTTIDWRVRLIDAINAGQFDVVTEIIDSNREATTALLRAAIDAETEAEAFNPEDQDQGDLETERHP